ncbi:hypothetical protein FNF27_07644 [Cafeteria roenbergensis]|uniref:RRM domain-containing protein n=1 Tax=Cafeteria roenbergensis TaxID=33653 RepID=A0A5A8C3V4_CAFRO|nr:hypothetical protein FNF31_07635 [Cafeteria roenbergensis]KAA0148954.1 hypothetical protein FNF28_07399 [Cafeteria roenbergensis]KAA0153547.1 hypothetical protein FNF29_02936 [Cafeteria roenbergensis]KAA0165441.1 hypothetical protein FNF27_07644 [Cafeteria roenbergensis]CAE7585222.1 Y14A [Symbiodinium sp. KB8]|eukprot:KAA0153547.1 hypothetical protein FNF29_02936 [Cafeteria roenbergensis]
MDARAGAAAAEARPSPVTDRATVVPCKSVEGWVVFVSGVHEEAADDDLIDLFGEHGQVLGVTVSLDRETGLSKGYGLVEFETKEAASAAVAALDGANLLGKEIGVTWAFAQPPTRA